MTGDDYSPNYPSNWDAFQKYIVDESVADNPRVLGDPYALELIDLSFYDMDISKTERQNARAAMAFYFLNEYDIDIFDTWDYEDYRDWYDAA